MAAELTQVNHIPILKQLYIKALKDGKPEKLPVFLDASVLDLYREKDGYKIIRTDTTGRISKLGSWSLDFGISDGDTIIQTTAESFIHRLPDTEKEHWLTHSLSIQVSENFIKGAIRPGCLDDGMIRNW